MASMLTAADKTMYDAMERELELIRKARFYATQNAVHLATGLWYPS